METALQGAKVWSSELGEFISQSHVILAGMLADYSEGRFSLAYLPAASQGAFGQHKPFQIQERIDGRLVPLRDLTYQEVDDPGEVMAWIAFGDIRRRGINTVFEELEFKRITNAAIAERQREEERADRREMIETLASGGRDHKHFFRHNGKTFRR